MSESGVDKIMSGIAEIKQDLAVHDSKASLWVERITATEERIADAVSQVAESTKEIVALVKEMRTQNGRTSSGMISLDRKTLMWLIGLAVAGSAALGGGQELVHRLFHMAMGGGTP